MQSISSRHRSVAAAAERSQGVLAREEILRFGISRSALYRRIASGEWTTIFPGAIRVTRGESDWHQLLAAARIWAGKVALASHRAAAALWHLDGFPQGILEVVTSMRKQTKELPILVHLAAGFDPADIASAHQIPVTSPTRTLIDLGAVTTRDRLELALDDALRRRLTSTARLSWYVDLHSKQGRRGIGMIKSLLEEKARQQRITESGFETRLFQLLRAAGLPPPVPQYVVRDEGRFVARTDFAYPDVRLAIEAVSYRWHSARRDWNRDQTRGNSLAAVGWRVLNVTWEEMRARPTDVVAAIRAARGDEGFLFI